MIRVPPGVPPKPLQWGGRRVTFATLEDMPADFWVVSWSAVFGLACLARPTNDSRGDKGSRLGPAERVGFGA